MLVAACSQPEPAAPVLTEPVTTYSGTVQGTWSQRAPGIRVFKGIPYAQPPTGPLRWRPPQAPRSWTGPLVADQFGPACTQPTDVDAFVWSRGSFEHSEDCLYLNIWASEESDVPKAVMVWFHGGSHTAGMAHDRIFDGAGLAAKGVVLVSVNYRLGPFGFLAHPLLAAESNRDAAGNYGLLDKIAALNWVRDNIAQFGGDANNITIFGQSAGAQSVCALMASPIAQGLFHKAIGQSASCLIKPRRDLNGRERGIRLLEEWPQDLAALRQIPAAELTQAAQRSGWKQASRIVVDGWVLPQHPADRFADGLHNDVPLLVGNTANEGYQLIPLKDQLSITELDQQLNSQFGERAPAVKQAYAQALARSPGHAAHAIATDIFMTLSMRRWAGHNQQKAQPTYLYHLDHQPPAFRLYRPEAPELTPADNQAGAYHSSDLAYVFNNTHSVGIGWDENDHQLADELSSYWTNFAKTGDPNGSGLPKWPQYEPNQHTTMLLNDHSRAVQGIRRAQIDLLEQTP